MSRIVISDTIKTIFVIKFRQNCWHFSSAIINSPPSTITYINVIFSGEVVGAIDKSFDICIIDYHWQRLSIKISPLIFSTIIDDIMISYSRYERLIILYFIFYYILVSKFSSELNLWKETSMIRV